MKSNFAKDGTRLRDKNYLAWIRTQTCHVRKDHGTGEPDHGKAWGKGMKGPDHEALPLCRKCHRDRHDGRWMYGPMSRGMFVDKFNKAYCKQNNITLKELRGK